MRTRLPLWLAAAALLAACAPGPATSTATGAAVMPPPPSDLPQSGVSPVPQLFDGWDGRAIDLNQPAGLPRLADGPAIAWKLVDRDRDKGRIEGGFLYPTAPGGLTVEGQAAGRKAYMHFAVRGVQPTGGGDLYAPLEEGTRVALFPRPVIVRDRDVWARFWAGWSRAVYDAPRPAPEPGVQPAARGAFFVGSAPLVDFRTSSLLFVDLAMPGDYPPVVTHVEGRVIHLAHPDGAGETPTAWPTHDPATMKPRTFVFRVPAVPAGATVVFDAFPESARHPRLAAGDEAAEMPFPVAPLGFAPPTALGPVRFSEVSAPMFRVHLPAANGGLRREAPIRSVLWDGDRPAWIATITWTAIEGDGWQNPTGAAEAAEREAGTLAGPAAPFYWLGVAGHKIPRAGAVDGRPMTGALYVATHEGRQIRFQVTAFSDVAQPERYAGIEAAVLANWRWR